MKKVLSLVLTLCIMLAFVPSVGMAAENKTSLDGQWDFKYYADASKVPEDVTKLVFEDKISVPGAMELSGYGYPSYFYEEMGGWGQPEDDGVKSAGVYRTSFNHSGAGYLVFDNVEDNLKVYLNGEKLIESKLGEIGTAVKFEGKGNNEIICVVERNNSGINKKDDFNLSGFMGSVYVTDSITVEQASKKVEVNKTALTIDGKRVVLKGVKYNPTHPETGNAITENQIEKDLMLIKEYGFNAVWTSCAPDALYEKAEQLGLYVIDEANVNLDNADRDFETAKKRVEEMVERHFGYKSIIMWSVGNGDASRAQNLISAVKELDSRPVTQEVTFAPEFEIFGNTGGMSDWVKTLGYNNVGGFVNEFADKELYYTQNAYVFDVKDSVTGEKITIDGEVENYKGEQYLGDAAYVRNIESLDKYTIVTELSAAGGDRVIFESGSVKLEVRGERLRFYAADKNVRANVAEGKVAAVYADGEIQLFINNSFAANEKADASVKESYTVGKGDTSLRYVEIYNDALTLDELIEGADESKLISRVQFDDINIKEDKSYSFLAYGGDFGDNPNSYYKCLTGLFTSTREPHPEAEAFKILLETPDNSIEGFFEQFKRKNESEEVEAVDLTTLEKVTPATENDSAVWQSGAVKVEVSYDGKITSFVNSGKELLLEPMYPTVLREKTLNEYETGVEQEEEWKKGKAEVIDNTLCVELISTKTEGRLILLYYVTVDGALHVSMQSRFSDGATKPTFIGFRGVGDYDKATWLGQKTSEYPDRRALSDTEQEYTLSIDEMSDNYTIAQENGNKIATWFALENENGNAITFGGLLNCQVHNYSPRAIDEAERASELEKEDKAYFRVGGYIAGVSDAGEYKLNENIYGFSFSVAPGVAKKLYSDKVWAIYANDYTGYFNAFTPGIKTYVYRTNNNVKIVGVGEDIPVVQDDKKAVVNEEYTIYFAPDTEYMSDMTAKNATAEIALDSDFSGNSINMRGNDYWAPSVSYEKGVAIKGGSVTYDVSSMTGHTFTAVVGKNDFDWRSMGMGFDRSMFDASCSVTIALDGVVVEEIKDVSMRSGSREVNVDVSDAKELTITVAGNGAAPQYEEAVLANAAFVPVGPILINFENKDGKAEITVLNTDKEYVDVVLSATENGVVTTTSARIGKGLYRTISLDIGKDADVQAVVTGLGKVDLE